MLAAGGPRGGQNINRPLQTSRPLQHCSLVNIQGGKFGYNWEARLDILLDTRTDGQAANGDTRLVTKPGLSQRPAYTLYFSTNNAFHKEFF